MRCPNCNYKEEALREFKEFHLPTGEVNHDPYVGAIIESEVFYKCPKCGMLHGEVE